MNFLEMNGLQTAQTHFKDIFRDNIHRDYADAMLDWLERETDFFTAPSSTKYHGAHTGGLLAHSLNVRSATWRARRIQGNTAFRKNRRKRWRSLPCCMMCAR